MEIFLITILATGLDTLLEYLSLHVLSCLVPAFFIAGAISVLLSKETILKFFGASTKKWVSYSVAALSGTVLAVCSCTILPMFAGINRRGAGIGPATAFLFSGPAINLLAIVLTARVLGLDLGIARAVAAVGMSVVIGLIMAAIFERGVKEERKTIKTAKIADTAEKRPWYITFTFFIILVAILLIAAGGYIDPIPKLVIVYLLTLIVSVVLIFYYSRDEVKEWGRETWWLVKRIFPVLLAGTFFVGVIGGVAAIYAPSHDPAIAVGEMTKPYLGDNSFTSCFLASVIGAILYMPTLLEVPIVGNLFGYSSGLMGAGAALSLLLAGPSLSLPNMIVIWRVIGGKRASVYITLVVLISTLIGVLYGGIV
ncbi:MAG TPA: permease [Candidatus Methanoperedenaceae archaeon]|nr:permease [Candidatus Methanoperedenaceae archaeon]